VASLRGRLPRYMVPGALVTLDELPLTAHGKVDRARLRELSGGVRRPTELARPPETEVERTLARIWGEVLEVDAVGMEDDFFDLGGHSLLAIEMLSRIQSDLGVSLTPAEFLEAPTIAGLTSAIDPPR